MSKVDELLAPLRLKLEELEPRERLIVIVGSILLALMMFYLIIWEPITSRYDHQQLQYSSQRQLYSWMQDAGTEIRSLSISGGKNKSRFRNHSISSLADRSAATSGVKSSIEKMTQSKKGVKINLKSANFDRIVIWLNDLETKYGINASKVKIETSKIKGAVNASITLERLKP
ncbi:hypothetical protein MNBD_GAMMA07-326 [hydrothermal vent metagenome]|uniref:General secretion pathway protein M n=1 Tax=hydrothermal vent metagenome TaxID=652676 RepID=A0A3B0WSA3_9ZZZZ